MLIDILSHHIDALENLLALSGVLQLNTILLLHHDDQLQGIDAVKSEVKEEEKETEGKKREKKSHRNYKKKNYMYKIDNIYQKAKIKNLE